jgi:hypothetical protein
VGLEVTMMSTGCWRGFICEYEIVDGALMLVTVELALSDAALSRDPAPVLFGVRPGRGRRNLGGESVVSYTGFREQVGFTGTLLLGRGFVREFYVHSSSAR